MKNKNSRKLTRFGGHSIGLLLPLDILWNLGWREKQRVLVKRVARGIMIMDAKSKKRRTKT